MLSQWEWRRLVRPYEPDFSGPGSPRNPWDVKKHPDQYDYIQNLIEKVDSELVRPPKYSDDVRLRVYRLRDEGYTLRQIADEVGVSKSTACLYIQKLKSSAVQTAQVTQPGTNKVVNANYSLNQVNVGKIIPKTLKFKKSKV